MISRPVDVPAVCSLSCCPRSSYTSPHQKSGASNRPVEDVPADHRRVGRSRDQERLNRDVGLRSHLIGLLEELQALGAAFVNLAEGIDAVIGRQRARGLARRGADGAILKRPGISPKGG
jgi:hypothetical protein